MKFREAERESVTVAEASAESAVSSQPGAAASAHSCTVIRPGLQLLVQDLGRPGFAAMGVSSAGAADRGALQTANRLVGNAESAAGLRASAVG